MKVVVDVRSFGKIRKMGVEEHLLHSIAPAEALSDNRPISFVMTSLLRGNRGKPEKTTYSRPDS